MRIRRRPMQIRDVQACAELVAAHPLERKRYGNLLGRLAPVWKELVRNAPVISGVLEDADDGRPAVLAFGLNVFVTEEFLRHCKVPSLLWIGPELLCWQMTGRSPVLGIKGVRAANSGEGLISVAWAAALAPRHASEHVPLQMELMNGFIEEHLGYKIKELVSQPIEPSMMEVVLNSGGLLWDVREKTYVQGKNRNVEDLMLRPFVLGANLESATQHLTWTSTIFQYRKPCIYFRPAEQRLLMAALNGTKDQELSRDLKVSLSFVKKTWCSIYNRVAEKLPEVKLDTAAESSGQRGRQKRQLVLSYVREHPEEIRPIALPSTRH